MLTLGLAAVPPLARAAAPQQTNEAAESTASAMHAEGKLIDKALDEVNLRPDQKIVYLRNWEDEKTRLAGVAKLLQALVKIARTEQPDTDAALPPPTPEVSKPKIARRA